MMRINGKITVFYEISNPYFYFVMFDVYTNYVSNDI